MMNQRFQTFFRLFLEISRSINKIKENKADKLGLKSIELMILIELKEKRLTAAELARKCFVDKAAISRSINALNKQGYIQVEINKNGNNYGSLISLSKDGQLLMQKIVFMIDDIVNKSSANIASYERKKFYDILSEISCNMQRICQKEDENEN